jgi:nitrogen fixation protein FixH
VTGGRPLTGRAVLAIALGAFGVILGANLLLAWLAVGTFSGVVVDNRYVASRTFDADRRAQEALGWTLAFAHEGDLLRLELTDAAGRPVRPATIAAVIGRPASARDDRTLELAPTPSGYVAEAPLAPGAWALRVDAVAASGVAYHRRERLLVEPAP